MRSSVGRHDPTATTLGRGARCCRDPDHARLRRRREAVLAVREPALHELPRGDAELLPAPRPPPDRPGLHPSCPAPFSSTAPPRAVHPPPPAAPQLARAEPPPP